MKFILIMAPSISWFLVLAFINAVIAFICWNLMYLSPLFLLLTIAILLIALKVSPIRKEESYIYSIAVSMICIIIATFLAFEAGYPAFYDDTITLLFAFGSFVTASYAAYLRAIEDAL